MTMFRHQNVMSKDGTCLEVWHFGSGPAVIISSPIGIHPDAWLPVADALSGRASLVVFSCRGIWGSDLPGKEDAVTIADHSSDIIAIAESLGNSIIGYVGYCSGVFALLEALKSGLVSRPTMLVSPLLQRSGDNLIVTKLISRLIDHPRSSAAALSFIYNFSPPDFRNRVTNSLIESERLRIFLMTVRELYLHEPKPDATAGIPMTFVVADEDRKVIRKSIINFIERRSNPGDKVIDFPGDHFSILKKADKASECIASWLGISKPIYVQ